MSPAARDHLDALRHRRLQRLAGRDDSLAAWSLDVLLAESWALLGDAERAWVLTEIRRGRAEEARTEAGA